MTALASFLVGMVLVSAEPAVGLPFGVPPGPDEPMLARVLPEQCLLCVAWNGTAAPNAKSSNRTEQLLAEPEVQHFLRGLGRWVDQEARSQHKDEKDPAKKRLQDEGVAVVETLATCPGVLWIEKAECRKAPAAKPGEKESAASVLGHRVSVQKAAAVFFLGKNTEQRAAVEKLLVAAGNLNGDTKHDDSKSSLWKILDFSEPYHLQIEGDCLIATSGQGVLEAIQERMKANQPPPAWWSAIAQQLPVERRSVAMRVDLRAMRELGLALLDSKQQAQARTVLDVLGLSNATSYVEAWGLEGEDFANKSLLVLDGEPQGLLKLATANTLKPDDLRYIPRDATLAVAVCFDAQQAAEEILAIVKRFDPSIEEVQQTLWGDFSRSTLKAIGKQWCIYASPSEGNLFFTGLTAVVPLRDWAGMNLAYGQLMTSVKQWTSSRDQAHDTTNSQQMIGQFSFQDYVVYYQEPPAFYPYAIPAWCMTKGEMVLALSPSNIKSYLARDSSFLSFAESPVAQRVFAKGQDCSLIAYADPKNAFRMFYPIFHSAFLPYLSQLRSEGKDIDASWLPSCLSVDRHMGPTTATLRRTKYGIEFVSRGTIPLPSVPLLTALVIAGPCAIEQRSSFPSNSAEPIKPVGADAGGTKGNSLPTPTPSGKASPPAADDDQRTDAPAWNGNKSKP